MIGMILRSRSHTFVQPSALCLQRGQADLLCKLREFCSAPSQEQAIQEKLRKGLNAVSVDVVDTSGGCGSMYSISVESAEFTGKRTPQQHRMVTALIEGALKACLPRVLAAGTVASSASRADSGRRCLVSAVCSPRAPVPCLRRVLTAGAAGAGGLSPPRAHGGCRRLVAATCSQRLAEAWCRHVLTAAGGGLLAATCPQLVSEAFRRHLVPEACCRHMLTAGAGGLSPPRAHGGCRRLVAATCSQRLAEAWCRHVLTAAGGGLLAATCPQLVSEAFRRHVPTAGAGGLSPPRAHGGCRRLVAAT
ncbi:hypothetical protein CYMTET_12684 [Cymbomonas tetramitiformis]|uniref:Uncharacterized protein n=1 Tax=Cymbomonas tetramitiformis TaxID=36881 RepID=A0AAE0GJZ1_9CHLO|nr:hypothetical protein CYMTET_12684 [Cymbomonas tetramitiformis]